jgi:serine/threonine protein kinase
VHAAKLWNRAMTRETIARYELQSEIGRGGMAVVYLAYDPNFRRNVAIKLVSVNLQENLIFRERFEREAQLIAKIEHPAIVPVYDFGEQDKRLYLVMRLMPGGPLSNKIKEGRLTLGYVTQILSQIAPALDAVHAQGIVHRDLKPGNILFDGFGNPAISDFGIAHLSAATTDLTGSAVIGTPSYMSPEQVRGDINLDGRSDVYALGVILFEMLTGRGPFQATTPMSVALKHLTDPIPSIRAFRSDLPTEVELILNKAMAKDQEMRYANASELALELRAILEAFHQNGTPEPSPVSTPQHGEISTEVDLTDNSLAAFRSSSAPQLEGFLSNSNPSQKFPEMNAVPLEAAGQFPASTTNRKQSHRTIPKIAVTTGVALLLLFLCGSISLFGTWASLQFTSLFSGRNPTAVPNVAATAPGSIQEIVLFSDDFSNPQSGWPTIQNAQGGYSYQTDGYHITVEEMDAVLWAKTSRADDNVSIYVDAKPVREGMNGYYGLLCRIQDEKNFYYFVVRSNGDYNIGKYKNGEFQPLFSNEWKRSDAINQGSQTNRLKANCSANILRFYANNVMLGEVVDTDFVSGFSGIVVAALDTLGSEVLFNNFLITQPGQ